MFDLNTIRQFQSKLGSFLYSLIVLGALTGATAHADSQDPYSKPDDSWITISGTVDSVMRDSFKLDYGDGLVTVEMDDGDRDADAYKLLPGDEVTVSGIVDDDFFEATTIEASSVYVADLNTTFYSSSFDDELVEGPAYYWYPIPEIVDSATVRGTVTAVSNETFILASGDRRLIVNVDDMPYNPLDDEGYQRIGVGDKVTVRGEVRGDLFQTRQIMADSVVKLHDRSIRRSNNS